MGRHRKRGASPDEIKKSYYSLAKKYHPDRYHQSKSEDLKNALEVIFSTLAQAYDTLKVPATRGSYDAKVFRLETPAGSPDKPAPAASPSIAAQHKLADLNYRQGRGQYDQQDYWSAIQAFRQSVRMEPEVARYRYWLAMALSKKWITKCSVSPCFHWLLIARALAPTGEMVWLLSCVNGIAWIAPGLGAAGSCSCAWTKTRPSA